MKALQNGLISSTLFPFFDFLRFLDSSAKFFFRSFTQTLIEFAEGAIDFSNQPKPRKKKFFSPKRNGILEYINVLYISKLYKNLFFQIWREFDPLYVPPQKAPMPPATLERATSLHENIANTHGLLIKFFLNKENLKRNLKDQTSIDTVTMVQRTIFVISPQRETLLYQRDLPDPS